MFGNSRQKKLKKTMRTHFEGTGKLEPLKHQLQDFWSRHIDHENRLVYHASDYSIEILSYKLH
ncbi:MAG: Txe/YoeB family addiction module toxin [Lachnospirales bacterium]